MNTKTRVSQDRPAFPTYRHRSSGFVLSGFAVATAVSTGLFWIMHQLISIAQADVKPSPPPVGLQFVILKREEHLIVKPPRKTTPPPVVDQPMPPAAQDWTESESGPSFSFPQPSNDDLFGGTGGGPIGIGEREYMPLTEISPVYPERALSRDIEGVCTVIYTITKTGAVKDVRADESKCTSSLFASAAVKAVNKFKYAPRIVDGQHTEVRNVTKFFRFSITD